MPQVAPILANIAVNLALGIAAGALAAALRPTEDIAVVSVVRKAGFVFELQIGESQPLSSIVGLSPAQGHLIYANEFQQSGDQHVQLLVVIGNSEHEGLHTFKMDGKAVTLFGDNSDPRGMAILEKTSDGTEGGTPYAWIKTYTGVAGQVADPELVARSDPGTRWTGDHKCTGMAYHVITLRQNSDIFGSSLPVFGFVWRGLKLYDWRKDSTVTGGAGAHRWAQPATYEYSANPVVIRWNFRRGIWINGVRILGQGFSALSNDLEYYTSAANICDESIYSPEFDQTFARYEFGAEINSQQEPLSILRDINVSYSGAAFERGGADAPVPAAQVVSLMTLEDSHRLVHSDGSPYPVQADLWGAVSTKKTDWHGFYLNPDDNWTEAPYGRRSNAALIAKIGGRKSEEFDQRFEHNEARAQYRAETKLRRQLFGATRTETFSPAALHLEPGDAITRNCEWGAMLMLVERRKPLQHNVGVELTLRQWDNSIVPASGDSFADLPSGVGTTPATPTRTLIVSAFDVQAYQRAGGGAEYPCARATWAQITDPNVDQVMIRVWPTAGSEANDAIDFFGNARLQSAAISEPLAALTNYTSKAIPIRSDGRTCVWTNTTTFDTGEMNAAVADGSIDFAKLHQELQNLSSTWLPRAFERMDEFEVLLGDLAQTVMDNTMLSKEKVTGLRVANAAASATVLRIEKVLVEGGGALADLEESVLATFAEFTGGSSVRWHSQAGTDGASANLVLQVFSEGQGGWGSAGLMLQTFTDAPSRMVNWADQIIWTDGTEYATPAVFENGILYLGELKVKLITSPDGETMVLDAIAPSFEMTSSS